jgi:hypothetical protein
MRRVSIFGQERKMTETKPIRAQVAPERGQFQFSCERIAYWFFRLNGCLILENFLIHHEKTDREGTEIDVLGVRFPHRTELSLAGQPMGDHEIFASQKEKIDIVIADSTIGEYCKVNKSWINPEKLNMQRILFALGFFPDEQVDDISGKLYRELCYEDATYRVNIYALGMKQNTDLSDVIIQLTWEEVLAFIHERFVNFEDYKRQHDQWDLTGKELFEWATRSRRDPNQFIDYVISHLTK